MVAKHGAAKHASEGAGAARGGGGRALRSVEGGGAGSSRAPGGEEGALALDRLIHERMRLGIVSALAVNDTLTFNDLKRLMQTTDGNLSVHARKLEDAAYVTCTKTFEGRMPKTEYRLTATGRRALERYLDHMEALIRATRER
jgi:DNA-binding HxlR family transcriptional regulator